MSNSSSLLRFRFRLSTSKMGAILSQPQVVWRTWARPALTFCFSPDSDEHPREQRCPCVMLRDPVEIEEPQGPGQPVKPIAYVSPMRSEVPEPTELAEAAEHRAWRRGDQVQRAQRQRDRGGPQTVGQTGRRRQWERTVGGSHSQAAFTSMRLMPVGMVQPPPVVYGYWAIVGHWVFVPYPYIVFIPMDSTALYFM